MRSDSNFSCMRRMAQNRLTAVGRVLPNGFADLVEVSLQIGASFGFGILHAERNAHGGGDADGGRSADHHVADHVRDLLVGGAGYVDFFGGQLRLVDEDVRRGQSIRGFES